MDPIRLAIDVGPLHGHRTGIGAAVGELTAAFGNHDGVQLRPYVLSFRSRPAPPTHRLPLPAALAHRLWSRADRPRADRWLGDANVIHGTNYVVPPSRRARVVSVYDCWFLTHPEQASPAARRAGEVLRRSVSAGATVHASSAATAATVREALSTDRVVTVHLGPLSSSERPAGRPPHRWIEALDGAPLALAVGTTERRKNLPALVDAFGRAATELGDVRLVLAGAAGDDEPAIDAAVDALPAARRAMVVRPGLVDAATKAWLFRHAAVLAYPSLDEGFGFPILEAQSAGLAVVGTRAGSIPEIGGDGVELVGVGDVDALAAALVRVLTDDLHREWLVAAGRVNVRRFSWAATADGLVQCYRSLLDGA